MKDVCEEACGWLAAAGSMLAFGSFGAPIKSNVVAALDVDPLVFQTYKTGMCFLTSWIVLLMGQKFTYTPWGIVSGFFWVPGGVATIFAVKSAGLAVGIGVGSSFIVLVSFVWGIFIFQEGVRSKFGACFAIFLMILGILGMSRFSAPEVTQPLYTLSHTSDEISAGPESIENVTSQRSTSSPLPGQEGEDDASREPFPDEMSEPIDESRDTGEAVIICGIKFSKRALGIMAAVFNGTWGGSIMVPMHWSGGENTGVGYVISFAIGASVITVLMWILRYLYSLRHCRSFHGAFQALPSFHFQQIWLQGCTCGLLWSIGNFFSVISVEYLGEGVGYSVIQAAMLVSGLWGIFYFREITKPVTILKWFLSASLTVSGIILLSYEHQK